MFFLLKGLVNALVAVVDLIDVIKQYNPSTNVNLIVKAYDFGLASHAGQMRKPGEPFFSHPVQVARILT